MSVQTQLICIALLAAAGTVSGNSNLERCLCYDNETDGNCHGSLGFQCADYGTQVAMRAWPSVAGVVYFSIVVPIIALFLYLCRRVLHGAQNESRQTILICYRATVCCIIGAAVVCCAVAATYSVHLVTAVSGLNDVIVEAVDGLDGNTTLVRQAYFSVAANFPDYVTEQTTEDVDEATLIAQEKAHSIYDAEDKAMLWNDGVGHWESRLGITAAFCGVCIVVFGFVLLAGCSRRPCCSLVVTFFVCMTGFIIAVTCMVYSAVDKVSGDMCDDYDAVAVSLVKRASGELGCDTQSSGIGLLSNAVGVVQANFAYAQYEDLCVNSEDFSCTGLSADWDTMRGALSNENVVHSGDTQCTAPCTVAKCATECQSGSDPQQLAVTLVDRYTSINPEFESLDSVVATWATCSAVNTYLDLAKPHLCENVLPQSENAWSCTLALMVLMVIITGLFFAWYAMDDEVPLPRSDCKDIHETIYDETLYEAPVKGTIPYAAQ